MISDNLKYRTTKRAHIGFCLFLLSCLVAPNVSAISCYLTIVKDNCWKNRNVAVDMMNADTGEKVLQIIVPEGKMWARGEFPCKPKQVFEFKSIFYPVFWAGEEEKVYSSLRYWALPEVVKPNEIKWGISLCYAKDFSSVPLPPDTAKSGCVCEMQKVPRLS